MKQAVLIILLLFTMNTISSARNNSPIAALDFSIPDFTAIKVEKGVTVILQQGLKPGISVRDADAEKALVYHCRGAQLRISKKFAAKNITVYVTCTQLDKIRVCYGGKLIGNNINGTELELLADENATLYFSGNYNLIKSTTRNSIVNISGNYIQQEGMLDYNGRYTVIYTAKGTALNTQAE